MDDNMYSMGIVDINESVETKALRMADRIIGERPVKYLPEHHIPILITLFAKGGNVSAFCAAAEICRKTFNLWTQKYPAFHEAYNQANQLAMLFWEKFGDANYENPAFNTKLWSIKMRNCYDYTDQRKLKISSLKKAANTKEQINCIIDELAEGNLTGAESNQLGNLIKTVIEVDTHTDLKADIKGLKERLGVEQ